MDASKLYDKTLKMIDECYDRHLLIITFPNGSISKKRIHSHDYYYFQYRIKDKIYCDYLKNAEAKKMKTIINQRKYFEKLNKEQIKKIKENIKIIKILDKSLYASIKDEYMCFTFDLLPLEKREDFLFPFKCQTSYARPDLDSIQTEVTDIIEKWVKGKARARDISNFLIQKFSD